MTLVGLLDLFQDLATFQDGIDSFAIFLQGRSKQTRALLSPALLVKGSDKNVTISSAGLSYLVTLQFLDCKRRPCVEASATVVLK